MRNRALHDALREFALESAALLSEDQKAAELTFDVVEERRRGGPTLYRYEPRTEQYIGERWERLRSLPTCPAATEALGAGARQYLEANGLRGGEPEPALRAMLERLYEDATSFAFPEERFETVYREVERTLYQDSTHTTVAARLRGVELEPERVELGDGLSLVREGSFEGPLDWGAEPGAVCLLERDVEPGGPSLLDEAAVRFRLLELGLRLYKPGVVSLSALAWTRPGGGRWQAADLGYSGGAGRGVPWILVEGEEAELREFLHAVARSTHGGAVAWALGRFEMGCSRELEAEALSDYLLGLRALLDAGSDTGQASMGLRLAALCAEEDERRAVQRRVELALALERFVMAGGDDRDYVERIGSESPRLLVSEMERHLRALLRDVLCGFLAPDLKGLADDILLKDSEPEPPPAPPDSADSATEELEAIESAILRVRRLTPEHADDGSEGSEASVWARVDEVRRAEVDYAEVEEPPLPEAEPPPEVPEPEPEPVEEPPPVDDPEPIDEPPAEEPEPVGMLDGVTPSTDWDDYSAPV